MARHEHADLIHLWAEGAEIEYKGKKDTLWYSTSAPQWDSLAFDFRIKPKEPEWYEKIPEHGILCWVKLAEEACSTIKRLAIVIEYSHPLFGCTNGCHWCYATPLTDDEIRQFLRGEQ